MQPKMYLSPDKSKILLEHYRSSSIEKVKLAYNKVQLAGIIFGGKTGYHAEDVMAHRLSVKQVHSDDEQVDIMNIPEDAQLFRVKWSPDGEKVAFCRVEEDHISLWYCEIATLSAKKMSDRHLGFSMEYDFYKWSPDSKSILCATQPHSRTYPEANIVLDSPTILEHTGQAKPNRTFQGLLKNTHDERLFDYYGTSQLVKVDLDGTETHLGHEGILLDFIPSPDGRYVLIDYAQRPYSYQYTVHHFPMTTIIYDTHGTLVSEIYASGLRTKGGLGRDAAIPGSRYFTWRHDADATLFWQVALDEGNPDSAVVYRDALFELPAPFTGEPRELAKTKARFYDIFWGNDSTAIVQERWWKTRKMTWLLLNPQKGEVIDTLANFSTDAFFETLGRPYLVHNNGFPKLAIDDGSIYLSGQQYDSVHAVLPVLSRFDLAHKSPREIWRSSPPNFDLFVSFLSNGDALENADLLLSRQSATSPRNLVRHEKVEKRNVPITFNQPFVKELDALQKRDLLYRRSDSLQLYGTLYYQKDHPSSEKRPLLIWAYPVEYTSMAAANEIKTSPYLYSGNYSLQQLLALEGFAVLDFASFPIVGEDGAEPNDTYLEQLRLNAEAALFAVHETGLVDTSRAAIAGHSYGAFMAANLLTHTNLFKTGIAQSGAYNRSLTPFGFQSEYRTYWEEQDLYHRISPFQQAHKLDYPILLFHGAEDNNSGTHRLQSERYFDALKGLGKTARYVLLPYEGHGYEAEETKIQVFEEMWDWLNKHLNTTDIVN